MKNEAFWTWFDAEARPKLSLRADTFAQMFKHLDCFERPVTIIETGCCRRDPEIAESWALDGCSTVLFDQYATFRADGSAVLSVDLNEKAVAEAQRYARFNTTVFHADSIEWLTWTCEKLKWSSAGIHHRDLASRLEVGNSVDLLYLDAFDYEAWDPLPSAIHHHAELMAAMPLIRPDTLVVVDDSPATLDENQRADIGGKGFLVARHMLLAGADMMFCKYQTGWVNAGPAKKHEDADLTDLINRARTHFEADRPVQAEHLYHLILGLTTPPTTGRARVAHGEACAFYAKMALARQKHGAASDWYREAIHADPLATDYRLKLILDCFLPIGTKQAALTEALRATRIAPDYPEAWHVLGGVYHELNDARRCKEAYDMQLALAPDDSDALLDRATIALDTFDYGLVRELCERVSADRRADALHCLAMVAAREHRHEDAIVFYRQAIEMGCRDAPTAHWNMSISLHALGRYREGWEEHEQRRGAKGNPALHLPMTRFTLPRWQGEGPVMPDGSCMRLHVHAEAGSGDNLAMLRYLPILADQGYDVRYEAPDGLVELAQTSMPNVKVFPRCPDYPGALGIELFDYHSPIGSVPAVLGTEIDTVPQNVPYLKADPELILHYKHLIAPYTGRNSDRMKIGLCWSSGIREGIWMREYGLRKSMHYHALSGLMPKAHPSHPSPLFISLQVGPERDQNDDTLSSSVIDFLPEKPTWEQTAALVANLDLVISVDTAIAHLAGGMGIPLWVMAQRDAASWHFLCWRDGSPWNEKNPWYPTARVFRQHTFDRPHYWDDVIKDVGRELVRELHRHNESAPQRLVGTN